MVGQQGAARLGQAAYRGHFTFRSDDAPLTFLGRPIPISQ
jgi:hypothetical protein